LIVVPSAVKNTAEKVETRKSSTNSKKEEILTKPQQEKEASSTGTSKDNPKILAFRRELEAIALKHLGTVPENNSTSTPSVNSGSEPVNTGELDPDDSAMPELKIFHKSETGIFDEASYDEEGVVTDFNSLPTEIEVSPTPTLRIYNIHPKSQILGDPKSAVQTRSKVQQKSGAHALISYIQKQQRNNHKDQQHCLFACFLSQEEPKKISDALQDDSWVQAMQEELGEQVEDINPTTLEAAAILTKVQKIKSVDKGKRYKRRKSLKAFAGTGLDFEEVKSAFEKVNTGGIKVSSGIEEINAGSLDVNTGIDPVTTDSIRVSVPSPDRGRREGKAPMTEEEETQASRKTKEQILQEEAGLAEAIRLDALEKALEKEEVAKQVHLDSLIAQRMAEEQELTEEQKKRKAQVQFEAQSYTEEDWDTIRAKLEANAELKESVLGKDLTVEDYAKRMVELVNQRRKHFAEERARAKRNKPMTQTQLRNYMSNFLKNQGTWKLTQLKKLNFEEVKAEFEKLVKQLDTYVPMNFEATKESLKRFGEELQTKTAKKLKFDDEGTQPTEEKIEEDKDDKPTKKTGKRRKQIARKGFHTDHDRDESEDSDEANEKDDSTSGTKIPINPVPVATKSPSIANYKIIKQGRKGVYQILRENGTDMVYISFGAMLTDISRDDLTELYRIVMKKHGMNEPEDEFEKVLWEYLKNMFEEPLSTDLIWSLPGQQRIVCWSYYDACRVHCLNLESADVYMLIERKYHLSTEVCKAILDKKLQGGKPDEDCYKLLKMIEKQAEWRQAIKEEYDALMKNGMWSLVPRASNTNVVDGIDFHEKFSSIVKLTTIQAILSLVVTNNWQLRQLDVHNAFLHENLKDQLGFAFALKDLGPLNYFLGTEIVPHVSGILLSQKKYILELLQSDDLSNCKPVSSPMVVRHIHASIEKSMVFTFTDVLWKGNPDTSLEALSDADWAGDSDDRRSTRGFSIYLGSHIYHDRRK
ncbi:putative ribonuclease H-like domain-containing protein, partial [Tanacetum coccineum]